MATSHFPQSGVATEHGFDHLLFIEKKIITPIGTIFIVGIIMIWQWQKNPSISICSF
jgi:hypothetical protein